MPPAGPPPLDVVFLIHSLEVGGAQRTVATTASAWPERRCLIVAALDGPLAEEAAAVVETCIVSSEWPSTRGVVRFMLAVRRIARDDRPTALLTNSFGVARVVLALKKLRATGDCAIIVVEHNTLSVKIAGLFRNRVVQALMVALTERMYRSADAIVGVSEGVTRDLEAVLRLPRGSVTTIRNPVDADRIVSATLEEVPDELEAAFSALPRPIVLAVGRMVAAKAHADLLDAFARLPDHARGSLVILGDGPLRDSIVDQAEILAIRERLWMPGSVENPWWFMARADVFALTSHWEGFPGVLTEALACEVPIVATDCPSGPREILEGVTSARLTPVGDPGATSAAIVELLGCTPASIDTALLPGLSPQAVAERYAELVATVSARISTRSH